MVCPHARRAQSRRAAKLAFGADEVGRERSSCCRGVVASQLTTRAGARSQMAPGAGRGWQGSRQGGGGFAAVRGFPALQWRKAAHPIERATRRHWITRAPPFTVAPGRVGYRRGRAEATRRARERRAPLSSLGRPPRAKIHTGASFVLRHWWKAAAEFW
ncbi:unnamed protein product, partial [Amoebophrya sp. A120]|eukprot:GSA120T00008771001.1